MVDNLTISPAGLALIEMLEQQSGISFEVVHLWLDPVRRSRAGVFANQLDQPTLSDELIRALRTGEVRLGQASGVAFGVFPLRLSREIVGCLIASEPPAEQRLSEGRRTMEEAGALARGILESDLQMNGQLAGAQTATRRLHATLRFLGQLGTYESDRDVMHAVLHAATVWFDLECRIYERQPDGHFALSGALPRVDPLGAGQQLTAARAAELIETRRFSTRGDLDDLGLVGRKDEVLILPVGIDDPAWLILLAGTLDSHAELTFSAITRVISGDLQAREFARVERWQRRLAAVPATTRATPERALQEMLTELVRDAGATAGRIDAIDAHGGQRELAATGSRVARDGGGEEAESHVGYLIDLTVSVALDRSVHLELTGPDPFGPAATGVALTWVKGLRPWLADLAVGPRLARQSGIDLTTSAFEQRIQEEVERARRFNLGLGLILIGSGEAALSASWGAFETVTAAVKPELRASDLLGRLPTDVLAVLLVHAGRDGAESVTERLSARLSIISADLQGRVQVGRAVLSQTCATAEDLIALARRESNLVPPILH